MPSGVPFRIAYPRMNGSIFAEMPSSALRNSKLARSWSFEENTLSMTSPIAGLNWEGNVLFSAASLGCRWRGAVRRRLRSGRRPARADLVDRLLLLADRILHLLHLALHRLKLALQVVDRGILGERARGEDEQRGERHERDTTPE